MARATTAAGGAQKGFRRRILAIAIGIRDSTGRRRPAAKVSLAVMTVILVSAFVANPRSAAAVFGNDYRELVSSSGATDTNTSVSISTSDNTNYIIDPYNTDSTLQGTPSASTPSGYGWRTPGVVGQVIPAGTWTFAVQTNTSGVTLGSGDARVRVYAYSTDILGGNVQSIGTATGATDLLTLLGGNISQDISFSAGSMDLTNRVLVVEYWVIVGNGPLLSATLTFNTVGSVTSVQLPAAPATTYYLSTPRLHSMGLDESLATTDSATRFYNASRLAEDGVAVEDSIDFLVTRSVDEEVTVSEQITPRISRFPSDSLAVTEGLAIEIIRPLGESVGIEESVARTYFAYRTADDNIGVADAPATNVTAPVDDSLVVTDNISAKVTERAMEDELVVNDDISAKVTAVQVSDTLALAETAAAGMSVSIDDTITVSADIAAQIQMLSVADSLAIADQTSGSVTKERTMGDDLTIADAISVDEVKSAVFVPAASSSGGGPPVDITTYPEEYFRAHPQTKVKLQSVILTDAKGNAASGVRPGEQMGVAITFKNYQHAAQDYAVIVQVLDSNGFTSDLGWVTGRLSAAETAEVSRSWTPMETGPYGIQILIWDDVNGVPMPLSKAIEITID